MSFHILQHVFHKTQHHGNAKVLLLALADYANDCCGLAWPAVETLAVKVGVNLRNTHKLLKQVSTGSHAELEVLLRQGPGYTNLYRFRGVSLETGCRQRQGVAAHDKGCPWRQGRGVARDRVGVSPATDNLSVELSVELSEPQAYARKKCGINGCDQPACPHWQQCAYHACCEDCAAER
jgi:hypothetical protein